MAMAGSIALVLAVITLLGFLLGAGFGATLAREWAGCRRVAMVGTLCMVPFMFLFWSFRSSTSPTKGDGYFWYHCAVGFVA